jgi:3,4-dihydroxy 2-butanone 4-phosphate synthase/GTP cyclohydrolase II
LSTTVRQTPEQAIEARDGVTTGISAADRARTVAVAIDSANGPDALVSPGHVFPLVARPGGVLVRAGHTEAAVDVARLAGLNPSGVICEIMREDGTMARLDDLLDFAATHGLKIGTIRDLIAYRLRRDHMVEEVADTRFASRRGADWAAKVFRDKASGAEQLALVHGAVDPDKPTLVRMHSLDLFADVLGEQSERSGLLDGAMAMIEAEGSGVVVALHAASPGSLSRSADLRSGKPAAGGEALRDYGIGAQILAALGIHDMILLTNTSHSPVGLSGYGLSIVEERPFRQEPDCWPESSSSRLVSTRTSMTSCSPGPAPRSTPPAMSMRPSPFPAPLKSPAPLRSRPRAAAIAALSPWASSSAAKPIISRPSPTRARAA